MCDTYTWQKQSLFIKDKPILSSEMILDKDYNYKRSVAKKKKSFGREPQEAKMYWLAVNHQL
jgi:hypothetical protein